MRGKLTLNQTGTVVKDIQNNREDLTEQIAHFRELQAVVMPRLSDVIGKPAERDEGEILGMDDVDEEGEVEPTEVEDEILYLPSDLTSSQREALQLTQLVGMEQQIRIGELYDAVKSVQRAAKAYSVTHMKRREDDRGTNMGLRSILGLKKIEVERDSCIADFNRARLALINLDFPTSTSVPIMRVVDTKRRSTFQGRQAGDSRRTDASLFRIPVLHDEHDRSESEDDEEEHGGEGHKMTAGTQGIRRKRSVCLLV